MFIRLIPLVVVFGAGCSPATEGPDLCNEMTGGTDGQACDAQYSLCDSGDVYAAECENTATGSTCTCYLNGVEVGTFDATECPAMGGDGMDPTVWDDTLATGCGWDFEYPEL